MRPVWLIEAGVYGGEIVPLLNEIRRQGMIAEIVPHQALRKGEAPIIAGRKLSPESCVIGYGTFPFVRQIQIHHPWTPGAWGSAENLNCAVYYAYFGEFLLNEHYSIMPGVEAIRQRDWLFSTFGIADEVFARPVNSDKLFVGRRIDRFSFAQSLASTRFDPATLVAIATPRSIEREWRLIVTEDRIIASSQYAVRGQRSVQEGCPNEVRAFAEGMLTQARWRPDPIFMLDVCESEGRLRLVELNGFSGSWLYQCRLSDVVAAASALAERQWSAKLR